MNNLANNLTQMRHRWSLPLLVCAMIAGLALCVSGAFAQSGAGSIQGTVTDATGAVIPGATIRVVNRATNVAVATQSSRVGFYQVPGLFAGDYTVTVTAPNMKTYKTSITLLVDQNAVINLSMTTGAVTQQVTVTSNAVQLTDTDNGTIATTLENARINQLPMNGRSLLTLAGMVTPGLEGNGQRSNGLMPEALEYVADGVTLSNRNFGGMEGGQVQLPDPDSVQEVRIETTDTGAEFTEPGTVIITTKSGTNQLHGALFETARNNAVGIAKNRNNPANYAAPHLVRNEWGISAGGPIVLPKVYHGKDKSFWFFGYERYSMSQLSDYLIRVPTQAMRSGDWSGLSNGAGILQQLYDPNTTTSTSNCNGTGLSNQWCRAPFANNQIPMARLSPTTKILYDILPQPTSTANPLVAPNFTSPGISFVVIPTVTFRLDHSFNENSKAYLRYTDSIQTNKGMRAATVTPISLAADGLPAGAIGEQNAPTAMFATALGYTHVFSPTFFSETILSQQWFNQNIVAGGNPSLNYEQMLGLPNNFGETGFPIIGSSSLTPVKNGTMFDYRESQIISNLDENLTKTVGRHQMQFGGRYRHERFGYLPDRLSDNESFGAYATALENRSSPKSATTSLPNTGYQDADMFLGAASSYSVTLEPPFTHYHDMEFDAYFQDNFHVSRNLTVNLGLRWEAHPAAWTKYGLTPGFDFKNDAQVLANPMSYYIAHGYTTQAIATNLENIGFTFESPSQAGLPSKMLKDYDLTFSPRAGLAYQPFGGKYGTVIRGAYGRYIYPVPVRNSIRNTASALPFVATYTQSYISAAQSPDGISNYLMRAPQSVVMGANSSNVVNSSTTNSLLPGQNIIALPSDYAPDFVTETNFTIEQPMKGNSVLRLTWLWSHGTNLDHYYYWNNHPSSFVWEMAYGATPPTGGASVIGTPQQNTYSATATGPYDQTKLGGGSTLFSKNGWSNDNALQATYQRLFHHGIAYQVNYVWSKPFRNGGNYFRDARDFPEANYLGALGSLGTMTESFGKATPPILPPARPAGVPVWGEYHALDKFGGYIVDTAIPKQHITFNGIVDLPFGRGKKFLTQSGRFMDEIVGGWQVAGDGSIVSQDFQVANGNWGPNNPIKVYKHHAPITDCRSGTCYKAYEWFNGYIAPTVVSGNTCAGTATKVVNGLPSGWVPYQQPIDTTCTATSTDKYYNSNEVNVTLTNGTVAPNAYAPAPTSSYGPYGANPYGHTVLNGPINYTVDLSLFKLFPITERVNLRVNVDAFNALNVQGYNNPNTTDGTEQVVPGVGQASSHNTPRQLQFTMRLTF